MINQAGDPPLPQGPLLDELLAFLKRGDPDYSPLAQPTPLHLICVSLVLASQLDEQHQDAAREQAQAVSMALGETEASTGGFLDIAERKASCLGSHFADSRIDPAQALIWFEAVQAYLNELEQWARQR